MDPAEDERRERELDQLGLVSGAPGAEVESLVRLATLICDTPTATLNIVTATHQVQQAAVGFDGSTCPREESMCATVLAETGVVAVDDASVDPRFEHSPFTTGVVDSIRFYASAPLVSAQGVTLGRLCVFDTEVRSLSARQAESLQVLADRVVDVLELRRSNERLGQFAAQVSHDLRSPLTAMMLNAELAYEEPAVQTDDHLRSLVGAILATGTRMSVLVEVMLDLAQVGADVERVPVDLDRVMRAVVDDLEPALEDAGAKVTWGSLPQVEVDERQIYSVLLNLVSNSVKFATPGLPPVVQVSATSTDGETRVEVVDNGIGVADSERDRVFEVFHQADRSRPGSGIGLATARRIVEAHGGRIGIDPADGGGSVAWFTLPPPPQLSRGVMDA